MANPKPAKKKPDGDDKALAAALESTQRAYGRLRVAQYLAQQALSMDDQAEFWPLMAEHLSLFFACDRVSIF